MGLLTPLGCAPAAPPPPPNIILITIDTLRADHLASYGYARRTTPAIDEIAAQGTIFEQAYAAAPWTAPSMASILTGVSPRTHGIRHGVFSAGSMRISNQEALDPRFPTIPMVLKAAGYETFGLMANSHLAAEVGYDRGFDAFASLPFVSAFKLAPALDLWLERIRRARPFFLWVHFFDPHAPYSARVPWINEYDRDSEQGEQIEEGERIEQRDAWSRMVTDELMAIAKADPPAGFREVLSNLYDSEINYMDRSVGRLLEKLGPLDGTAIVISADHGEEFLDHEALGHKHSLYEELLRVPLVIRLPTGADVLRRVAAPVSNQNIFPTLAAIAGIEPPPGLEGTSLLPRMTGSATDDAEAIFGDLELSGTTLNSVRLGKWKLIVDSRSEGSPRLFDLVADPREAADAAADHPDVVADLMAKLDAWREAHPLFEPERASRTVTEPVMQQLRAMGYVE